MTANNSTQYDAETRQLTCGGDWDLACIPDLKSHLDQIVWPSEGKLTVDGGSVTKMDSAGAWLLNSLMNKLKQHKVDIVLTGFPEKYMTLITLVERRLQEETGISIPRAVGFVTQMGMNTVTQLKIIYEYLSFVGLLTLEALRIAAKPQRLRWGALASVIFRTGYSAIPIIALLSFMIGVVITFQMGLQLKNYGANIFIVDLLGLAILREFGPLLTAIMVAGRSGSAFTAQLGMMKLNQEIDALDTMGVTPSELLILPRIA